MDSSYLIIMVTKNIDYTPVGFIKKIKLISEQMYEYATGKKTNPLP